MLIVVLGLWVIAQGQRNLQLPPNDPAAVALVKGIQRTYRSLDTFSCTVLTTRGTWTSLEFKRPDRFLVREYEADGTTVRKEARHDRRVTTVIDPKKPQNYLRFTEPDAHHPEWFNPVMGAAWPPIELGESIIALLNDAPSFLGDPDYVPKDVRMLGRAYHLGKNGTAPDGSPTVELLLIDRLYSATRDEKPYLATSTIVVGANDHLIRSLFPLGSDGSGWGRQGMALQGFHQDRVGPERMIVATQIANHQIPDSEFAFVPPPGAVGLPPMQEFRVSNPQVVHLRDQLKDTLKDLASLSYESTWSHSQGMKNVVCTYEFALCRNGAGRVEGFGTNPEANRFVAVSDGVQFRFTTQKTDVTFKAALLDGLIKMGAFGSPEQFAPFLGEPYQVDGDGDPMPMLCAPRAVSLMADFYQKEIPGLAFDDQTYLVGNARKEGEFDTLSSSYPLSDVFDRSTNAAYHQELRFDPVDHLSRQSSFESWYWEGIHLRPVYSGEHFECIQLNPSFNPAYLEMDPNRRSQAVSSQAPQPEFLPSGLPEMTLDGKPFSIADHNGKVVLIELHDKYSGSGKLTLDKLREIYSQDHAKGLDVFGMSLDLDKKDAIREASNLPWPQLFDGNGWKNKLISSHQIPQLPCYVVIDRFLRASVVPGTDDANIVIQLDLKNYGPNGK